MYDRALAIRPDYWEALNDLVHSLQHTCAWSQWGKKLKTLQKQLGVELRNGGKPLFVKPFHALVYPLKVEHMLLVASSYAARATRLVRSQLQRPFALSTKLAPGKKLRVGWVSSNIGDHSLSHLMRSVFGMHGSKVASPPCPFPPYPGESPYAPCGLTSHPGQSCYSRLDRAHPLRWRMPFISK